MRTKYQFNNTNSFHQAPNRFDFKQNAKQFGQHSVGYPGEWIIDRVFFNHLSMNDTIETNYLVLVNINSRYAYVKKSVDKTGKDVSDFIADAINNGLYITHIKMDGEKAFISYEFMNNCFKNDIICEEARRYDIEQTKSTSTAKSVPYHGSTAVLDRFVRTIRDILFMYDLDYDEETVKDVVDLYNNTEHKTIRTYINKLIKQYPKINYNFYAKYKLDLRFTKFTPWLAETIPDLKSMLMYEVLSTNYSTRNKHGYMLKVNDIVKIKESHGDSAKRRRQAKPELYKVISQKGQNVLVENTRTKEQIIVNRVFVGLL